MTEYKLVPVEPTEEFIDWLQKEMPEGTTIGDPVWWAKKLYKAVLNAAPQTARDREDDRLRFPDLEFNRWLDEVISDAGHIVWDQITDICSAWHGWENRQYYGPTKSATPEQEPVVFEAREIGEGGWYRVGLEETDRIAAVISDPNTDYRWLYTHPAKCKRCEECAEYLKEDETPLQRIQRDQKDTVALLGLLAKEKEKVATLEARNAELEKDREFGYAELKAANNKLQRAKKVIETLAVAIDRQPYTLDKAVCGALTAIAEYRKEEK